MPKRKNSSKCYLEILKKRWKKEKSIEQNEVIEDKSNVEVSSPNHNVRQRELENNTKRM